MEIRGRKGLASQWVGYFVISALSSLAGLILLPWHVHVLTLSDYTILVFGETVLSVVSILVTAGIPQAVVRYAPRYDKEFLGGTVFIGHITLCGAMLLLALLALPFLRSGQREVFILFALLGAMNSMLDVGNSFLRAEQSIFKYGVAVLFARYVPYVAGIGTYLLFPSLSNLLLTRFLFGVLGVALTYILVNFVPRRFSRTVFVEIVSYGFPLIALALSSAVLSVGDRIVVYLVGLPNAMGIYAATYNLANGLVSLLVAPFNLLVQPIYMRKWETEGYTATKQFLDQVLAWYVVILAPAILCLSLGARRLVLLILGSQFIDASLVVPIVGLAVAIYGVYFITGAGLFLNRATKKLGALTAIMALCNVLCNLVLVPLWGITGAAISTFISYTGLVVVASKWAGVTVRPSIGKATLRTVAAELVFGGLAFYELMRAKSGWFGIILAGFGVIVVCIVSVGLSAPGLVVQKPLDQGREQI